MRKLRGCLSCFIELDRIALADGSVVLMCVPCDTIGVERDIVLGARMWAGEMVAVKTGIRRIGK